MTSVITHRGLDATGHHPYSESSREAFAHYLQAGFGLEFDVCLTKDGIPVVTHDRSLERLFGVTGQVPEISVEAFASLTMNNGQPVLLRDLLEMIRAHTHTSSSIHALHLKHDNQTEAALDTLLPFLRTVADSHVIVFDITPDTATWLKQRVPTLQLAASVAHPHDVARYNEIVGGTLISTDDIPHFANLYDWVWLDEWDRVGLDGATKSLYTADVFSTMRQCDFRIAVVSPELHATSPALLGAEHHPDGQSLDNVKKRWHDILELQPDAVCTDYPYELQQFLI